MIKKNIKNKKLISHLNNRTKKQEEEKTLKTYLVEKVVFVFLVLRVLKMALFREQKKWCFAHFFYCLQNIKNHKENTCSLCVCVCVCFFFSRSELFFIMCC